MIELEHSTKLPLAATWERLTVTAHLRNWWAEGASLEASKRGKFIEPYKDDAGQPRTAVGTVTAFEPPKRLQINYQRQHWEKPTRIEFLLSLNESGGTNIYFQHSGWDFIPDEAARRREVDAYTKIWQARMDDFVAYCGAEG